MCYERPDVLPLYLVVDGLDVLSLLGFLENELSRVNRLTDEKRVRRLMHVPMVYLSTRLGTSFTRAYTSMHAHVFFVEPHLDQHRELHGVLFPRQLSQVMYRAL